MFNAPIQINSKPTPDLWIGRGYYTPPVLSYLDFENTIAGGINLETGGGVIQLEDGGTLAFETVPSGHIGLETAGFINLEN